MRDNLNAKCRYVMIITLEAYADYYFASIIE